MSQSYQSRIAAYPRVRLTQLPSPLDRASRLEASLRDDGCQSVPRIYLKRDDLLSLALGGNKIRNLEFLIGEALSLRATDVITAGRSQSNHCRLTAAACAKAGTRAHLVINGGEPSRYSGNLLLDRVLGAEIRFTGSDDRSDRERVLNELERAIEREGGVHYRIPVGGSSARGALGHVLAAEELVHQCRLAGEDRFDIYLATATGGTQAGLLVGLNAGGVTASVYGFAVAKSGAELSIEVRSIVTTVADNLGMSAPDAASVVVDDRALGTGYGEATQDGTRAIARLARTEGVLADPVYTGKALAGLFSLIAEGRLYENSAAVFIHTGGGPALFA